MTVLEPSGLASGGPTSEAFWALIGVIVGGLITSATQWILATQQGKREDAKSRQQVRLELRTACRLVEDEIDTLGLQLSELLDRGRSLGTPFAQMPHYLPVEEWEKGKGVLAGHVDDPTWESLAALYFSTKSLRSKLAGEPPGTPFGEKHLEMLRECVAGSNELKRRLVPYEAA